MRSTESGVTTLTDSPWIDVEHRRGEEPVVIRGDVSLGIRVRCRQRERWLAGFGDAELEHRVALQFDGVGAVVERRGEARVDVRDVNSLDYSD